MALAVASVGAMGVAAAGGAAVGAICSIQHMLRLQLKRRTAALEPGAGAGADGEEQAAAAPPPPRRAPPQETQPVGWQGFSMEEAREHADQGQIGAMARTPKEVLGEPQSGNARFWMGAATRPERSAFERRALISKQFPSVAVLACSDSRVPVEIVFDKGLGDMFVVRVAGNLMSKLTLGSLQYAVHHLKVKAIIIMGHEACGAVKAAGLPKQAIESEPPQLSNCLLQMKSGMDLERLAGVRDPRARDREAVVENIYAQVDVLSQDSRIMEKVENDELIICGAFYEISSGIVDFFGEISQECPYLGMCGVCA